MFFSSIVSLLFTMLYVLSSSLFLCSLLQQNIFKEWPVLVSPIPFFPFSFFFLKIGTWANYHCQSFFFFFFFSPKPPSTQLCILVVRASGCAMWDATSAWPGEWCHVQTQDLSRWNPRLPKWSMWTYPSARPPVCVHFWVQKNFFGG